MTDVVEYSSEELRECGAFASAEECEGVGLDCGWPVGVVGVQGVEEGFLDSDGVSFHGFPLDGKGWDGMG